MDGRDALNQEPRPGAFDATDLTNRFAQLVSSKRMTALADRARSPSSGVQTPNLASDRITPGTFGPPSYSSLRNLPKVATPPQDPNSLRFRNLLMAISMTPIKYENPGLLDEALALLPLERIWSEAEEDSQTYQAIAASQAENERAEWGYQDCVIMALLKYVDVLAMTNDQ